MHKYLVYAAFGTLTVFGALHFLIDVVSQHVRGVRGPGPETDLYYGLHSAYGLGQAVFGAIGLYVTWRAMPMLQEWPPLILALLAGVGWLAICLLFIEYTQPRFPIILYCGLILAAFFTRHAVS